MTSAAPIATALPGLTLRPLRPEDEVDLQRGADDPRVAATLRDRFPSPYTRADARDWIALNGDATTPNLAIAWQDAVVGGFGLTPGEDVHRFQAEVAYWLGVAHWGRGYATAALAAYTDHLLATTAFTRLFGVVFSSNPASGRVLEKCGYALESVARGAVFKDGRFLDALTYARLRG